MAFWPENLKLFAQWYRRDQKKHKLYEWLHSCEKEGMEVKKTNGYCESVEWNSMCRSLLGWNCQWINKCKYVRVYTLHMYYGSNDWLDELISFLRSILLPDSGTFKGTLKILTLSATSENSFTIVKVSNLLKTSARIMNLTK